MATSGSYNFNRNALQIVTEAMELIQVLAAGETMQAEDATTCMASLNMMIKAWQAEGIGLWTKKNAILFMGYGEYEFDIGPSGDNCTTAWAKTEIETAGSETDLTITIDDDDGFTDGDYIGIQLDDGTLQWTTINGVPAANVITITDALDDDAAVDNHVYGYTTKIQRPIEIMDVRLMNGSNQERPIRPKSRSEYMNLPNKTDTGTTNLVYYDPQLTNGKLYVWPACGNVQEVLKFTAKIPVEDFDSLVNDPDFPQEWLLPLSWNLAVSIAPKFGKELTTRFELRAESYKQNISGFDREDASIFFGVSYR